MTYDEWLAGIYEKHARERVRGYRFGQRYFNELPRSLSNEILLNRTELDPFQSEEVSAECHAFIAGCWPSISDYTP